jgi:hypothetical protein
LSPIKRGNLIARLNDLVLLPGAKLPVTPGEPPPSGRGLLKTPRFDNRALMHTAPRAQKTQFCTGK